MTNQDLANKVKELKEVLRKEKLDLEMRKDWVRETELKIEAIENEIRAIDNELKTEALDN